MTVHTKAKLPKKDNVTALPTRKTAARETFCGPHMKVPPFSTVSDDVPLADRMLHAFLGRFFRLSPAALGLTYMDWLTHLAISPGTQAKLLQSAGEKAAELATFARHELLDHRREDCCVSPLPQDRRFKDEGWKKWPYSFYQQYFLQTERWWEQAMTVRGMTQHHSAVQPFIARQVLDMWSPLNFPLTNPRVVRASTETCGFNFLKGTQNFIDDWTRLVTGQPEAGMEDYRVGENIAVTEGKVVYQNRLIELIQYTPTTSEVYADPLLIAPAWIMKYYILDLSPENSLVKYLVDKGHTVFMISWKNPDTGDRDLGFEDYLRLGIMNSLQAISAIIPDRKVHLAGYCLGGTLSAIAAATLARDDGETLKSLTMFTAQVDFEEAGELLMFTDESQLAWLEDIMWEKGYLDSEHMAGTFKMLRPRDIIWSRMVESYLLGERRSPNDLAAWNADATHMPYKMHSEYLRSLFLNNDISAGRFMIGGKPIALTDIRLPLFAVSTQRDHISPWHSVYKISLFTDTEVTFVLASGGHNAGIVSEPGHPGRAYQIATIRDEDKYIPPDAWAAHVPSVAGSWWPEWQKWLAAQSGEKVRARKPGAPGKGYPLLRDAPGEYVFQK